MLPAGGTKAPAAISSAAVMVVFGRSTSRGRHRSCRWRVICLVARQTDAGACVDDGDCAIAGRKRQRSDAHKLP